MDTKPNLFRSLFLLFLAVSVVSLSTQPSIVEAQVKAKKSIQKCKKILKQTKSKKKYLRCMKGMRRAAAIGGSPLRSIKVINAESDTVFSQTTVSGNVVTLRMPQVLLSKVNLDFGLSSNPANGILIEFGSKKVRERSAPYALFANDRGNYMAGTLSYQAYPTKVFTCSGQSSSTCNTLIYTGRIEVKPMEIAGPNPFPEPPSVIRPSITSLNQITNDTIVVEAGQSVYVKGIKSFHDYPRFAECLQIGLPLSRTNFNYVPVGDPNRSEWERKGDLRSACMTEVENMVAADSTRELDGKGDLMTATYTWNFGDSASSSVYNVVEGWSAAHKYSTPGSYSISLTVVNEQGQSGTKRLNVNVVPSTRQVYYISRQGSDSNSGTTQSAPIKTLSKVRALTADRGNYELRFKSGETHLFGTEGGMVVQGRNVVITTYGGADRARFLWTQATASAGQAFISLQNAAEDSVIENISFDTDLMSLFGRTNHFEKDGIPMAVASHGRRITLHNNEFKNVKDALNITKNIHIPSGYLIQKNIAPLATGLRGYLVWNGGGYQVSIFGNSAENSTREHIVRFASEAQLMNAFDNIFRNTDIDQADMRKGGFTVQAGSLVYLNSNQLHEGGAGFEPLGYDRGTRGEYLRFGKLLKNHFDPYLTNSEQVSVSWAGFFVGDGARRVLLANNMFGIGRATGATAYKVGIEVKACSVDYNRCASDITIAHNTFAAARDSSNRKFLQIHAGQRGSVKIQNNLMVMPVWDAGHTSQYPIGLRIPGDPRTATFDNIAEIGCNIIPIPTTYRSAAFNPTTHGVNIVEGASQWWPKITEWQSKMSSKRNGRKADSYLRVPVTNVDGNYIPALGYESQLSCPPVKGVSQDIFGRARGANVTAGAYQY